MGMDSTPIPRFFKGTNGLGLFDFKSTRVIIRRLVVFIQYLLIGYVWLGDCPQGLEITENILRK